MLEFGQEWLASQLLPFLNEDDALQLTAARECRIPSGSFFFPKRFLERATLPGQTSDGMDANVSALHA